jgi:glycosyltransferase involved in cell wall biosynthesis
MTGHNLLAMLALGDTCRGRRILAMHFHHKGVKPVWQWRLIYRVAVANFQAITFPSDFIRKEAEALYPPVAGIAHTVRNPLNVHALPTPVERIKARHSLGIAEDTPLVGNAGWLIPRKRFDLFLQVAARVAIEQPKIKFIIAGDGPERPKLEKLAARIGLTERLIWLGWQTDLTNFYQSLDVLLFNSDWDAMGLTPLEAMSYGVPVVASVANGGLSEVIDGMSVGVLFSQHDVNKMTDALSHLLINSEQRRLIGLAGREKVAEMSKPNSIAAWYENTLSGNIMSTGKNY